MMQVNDLWFQAFRVLALKCMDFVLDGHFKDSKIGHIGLNFTRLFFTLEIIAIICGLKYWSQSEGAVISALLDPLLFGADWQ